MGAPSFVQSITQDLHGFLWVGSADGLFRFDGVSFEPISPAREHKRTALAVSALASAPNGDIWAGYAGGGGVAVYRGNKLVDARLPGPGAEITQIIVDDRGAPWVINSNGGDENILRLEGARWVPVHGPDGKSFDDVIELASAKDGSMWAYTRGRIYVARPGETRFTASSITGEQMGAFARDNQGQMLLSDEGGIRRILTDPHGMPTRFVTLSPIPPFTVLRTLVDRQGVLWGTTFMNGAFYGPLGTPPVTFSVPQGITSPRASAIFLDRTGNVWIGSEGGLDRFSNPIVEAAPFLPANPQDPFNLSVTPAGDALIAAGDTIWDMSAANAPRPLSKQSSALYRLCGGTKGRFLALMETGLVKISHGKVFHRYPWPLEPAAPPMCSVREDGSVWVFIPGAGLFRLIGGKWEHVHLPQKAEEISDLVFDKRNRLILLINRQSIAIADGGRLKFWEGEKIGFERPTSINFLSGDVVIGGLTGLLRLRDSAQTRLDFETYPWLRDIRGLVEAPDGYVWLLGYHGISRVRATDLKAAFDKPGLQIPYQIFDDDNSAVGIPQRSSGPQAGVDRNGVVWFLTRERVFRVQPNRASSVERPVVLIRAVTTDGRRDTKLDKLKLPGGTRTISFDFSVADLTTPTHRRFRYWLEGYDTGWTEIGGQRQINLTNMRPGSYHLVIETDDERGQWVRPGAVLDFSISPLFHQTWWFRGLILLLVAAAIWLIFRWRIRVAADGARREAESRLSERVRIARDLHDTFLQGFQGSALRIQAVADRLPEESRERQGLEKVMRGVDDILEEGRRRVQALRSEDRPVNLDEAVEALAGDLLGGENIAWTQRVNGNRRQVAPDAADEALLIIREAFVNIVRHSQATKVELSIHYRKSQMEIDVWDDGIGIDAGGTASLAPNNHFGLMGMRERAQQIEAALKVVRVAPGTRITLKVPGRRAYADN